MAAARLLYTEEGGLAGEGGGAQRTRAARMGGGDSHAARVAMDSGRGPDQGTGEAHG